ncbi:hypothetical protein L6164_017211 [Bauhinia variegata]|uniref:Uncharacterized protein n=1 Tax=Bauhinia variegata TaxID=167791 RepID=A0ACB9N914_BAUVA|nr:hypothetical protein L6164_017211 [Bauhinia variegata]
MAFNKVGIVLVLLLCGSILFGDNMESAGVKACPQYCFSEAAYMTCPSTVNLPYKDAQQMWKAIEKLTNDEDFSNKTKWGPKVFYFLSYKRVRKLIFTIPGCVVSDFDKAGAVLLEVNMEAVDAARVCPLFCYGSAAYMTCPSSGDQHLAPSCNCCLAGKGCAIYTADRTLLCPEK